MASGDLLQKYAAKTSIAATSLASLANAAGAQSAVVDNSTTGYIDAVIRVIIASSATTNTALVDIYAYGALGDTTYIDGATGADAAFTAANRRNAKFIGSVQCNPVAAATAQAMFSIAQAFDGVLPTKWGLIFINNSGAALNATGNVVEFQGVYANVAP
jgi:hypothetical protein